MAKARKLTLSESIYAQLYERYHDDMEGFACDLFGSPGFDDWQRDIASKFYSPQKHLFFARASGHGTGKSYFAVIAALHFLLFHDDVGIVVTSNTRAAYKQVWP
jgi:Rad3-related DNA helicase